jgi:hypothetical protein
MKKSLDADILMSSLISAPQRPHDSWSGNEEQIKDIKRELIAMGLYNGSVDDMTDKVAFYQALSQYQSRAAVPSDAGIDKIKSEAMLDALKRVGNTNETVADIPEETSSDQTEDDQQGQEERVDTGSGEDDEHLSQDIEEAIFPVFNIDRVRELSKMVKLKRKDDDKHHHAAHSVTESSLLHPAGHSSAHPESGTKTPGKKKKQAR